MNKFIFFILSLLAEQSIAQTSFTSWNDTALLLNNGVVQRTIQLPSGNGNFITTSYKPITGEFNYFVNSNTDFQFEVDDLLYSGKSDWRLKKIDRLTDENKGDGAAVTLVSANKKIELTVQFLLYPNLPVIRKNLVVKNLSPQTAML